jgi:hypothetical protein
LPAGVDVPTVVHPAPVQVVGAVADGPKTEIVIVAVVPPVLPERVEVMDAAGMATFFVPVAGPVTTSVGVGSPTVVEGMPAPQALVAVLSFTSPANDAYHQSFVVVPGV